MYRLSVQLKFCTKVIKQKLHAIKNLVQYNNANCLNYFIALLCEKKIGFDDDDTDNDGITNHEWIYIITAVDMMMNKILIFNILKMITNIPC